MKPRATHVDPFSLQYLDLVILLIVLVAGLAFLLRQNSQHRTPRECRVLSAAELPAMVATLDGWRTDAQKQLGEIEELVERHCPALVATRSRAAGLLRPAPLAELCSADAGRVLDRYRTDHPAATSDAAHDPARLAGELARGQRETQDCLGALPDPGSCARTDEAARERLATTLTGKLGEHARAGAATAERLGIQCPELLERVDADTPGAEVPGELAPYCWDDVRAVLDRIPEKLRREAARSVALDAAFRECAGGDPVVVEVSSETLEFVECTTEFSEPGTGRAMTSGESAEVLSGVAARVAEVLRARRFNRIDVMGYADARPITTTCEGTRDNEGLSSLRALAFRRQLVALLMSDERYADIAERLALHELRFYAIGVGAAEPIVPEAASPAEHARNRRIALHFVRDGFRWGS